MTTNSCCRIDILWRRRKSGIEGYCSGNEELDRSAAQNLFGVLLSDLGNIERRNAEHMFAIDAQYLAARRQHRCMRAEPHDGFSQFRRGIDDMFAIVEEQKEISVADRLRDGFRRDRVATDESKSETTSHGGWYESRFRERREFDEPASVLEITEDATCRFN